MDILFSLFLVVVGAGICWRGYAAITTGEFRGKYGIRYTGLPAKIFGWVLAGLGPFVMILGVVSLFTG